jgi:hypothetical protein
MTDDGVNAATLTTDSTLRSAQAGAATQQTGIRFLVIGAPKAGTTSLFEYMRLHPQLHMPAEKELYFFNIDRNYRRGMSWYLDTVLRQAPPGAVSGEATTEYMSGAPYVDDESDPALRSLARSELEEVIPRRIRQALPEVKLICVLRDPVQRAYSHYRMMVLSQVESRSFEETVEQLIDPAALERTRAARTRTNGYIVSGEYARLLGAFLRVFPREQLKVIFSDELSERPAETVAELFEFIGVDADFVPENVNTRYRAAAVKPRIPGLNLVLWQAGMARVTPARTLWHALPTKVRHTIDSAYNVANYRVEMWNAWRGAVSEDIEPSVRERLIAHYRADSEALAELLDREVPWLSAWNASSNRSR